jgi:uncharacterized protein (DUF433 family)
MLRTVDHAGGLMIASLSLSYSGYCQIRFFSKLLSRYLQGEDFSFRVSIMDYFQYIERHPQICGGEPVIKGTRVTLRTLLASLAEGASIEEITADFPTISTDDVRAVIAFAAASAEEDLPLPAIPKVA